MLSEQTVRIVKEITPLVAAHAETITRRFYARMFAGNPEGRVTTERLRDWTPHAEASFFFCGPKPFMESVHASLNALGVDEGRIRYEFFGPKQTLQTAAVA